MDTTKMFLGPETDRLVYELGVSGLTKTTQEEISYNDRWNAINRALCAAYRAGEDKQRERDLEIGR